MRLMMWKSSISRQVPRIRRGESNPEELPSAVCFGTEARPGGAVVVAGTDEGAVVVMAARAGAGAGAGRTDEGRAVPVGRGLEVLAVVGAHDDAVRGVALTPGERWAISVAEVRRCKSTSG